MPEFDRIVGVDPSLTSTGIALVEGGRFTAVERVRTKLKGHQRVDHIVSRILEVADSPVDTLVGIEGTAMGAKGAAVVQIFGLWGIITRELWKAGFRYYVVGPTTLKKYATGSGAAGKDDVMTAVVRSYPDVDFTGNDMADAMVIAAIGARQHDAPIAGETKTKIQLETLGKVDWDHAG